MSSFILLAEVADVAARVGAGKLQGGWGYVTAAYGITWAGMLLYGVSLFFQLKRVRGKDSQP